MPSFNKVILLGNLTRDPAIKFLPSQMPVVEFGLAVNHRFKRRDGQDRAEVLFIDCTAFGKGAEVINQYCRKGKPLLVEGRLKYETWEDKQGGGRRSRHSVIVESFQFVGGRTDDGGNEGRPEQAAANQGDERAPQEFTEDDVPF